MNLASTNRFVQLTGQRTFFYFHVSPRERTYVFSSKSRKFTCSFPFKVKLAFEIIFKLRTDGIINYKIQRIWNELKSNRLLYISPFFVNSKRDIPFS